MLPRKDKKRMKGSLGRFDRKQHEQEKVKAMVLAALGAVLRGEFVVTLGLSDGRVCLGGG